MPLVPPMPTLREIDGPAAFFDIADKQEALDELKRAVDVAIDWCAKGGTVLASPATTSNASEHTPHADQVGASENRIDRLEGECVDHDITRIISFGPSRSDSLLDNAPAPPCSKCGKPGTILEITEEIVSVRDD